MMTMQPATIITMSPGVTELDDEEIDDWWY